MVMTSDIYHTLFEPPREEECLYILNEIRPKIKLQKLDKRTNVINNHKEGKVI